jgi:hypothetical protein
VIYYTNIVAPLPARQRRTLVARLPARKRQAATDFVKHGVYIEQFLYFPLPHSDSYANLAHLYLARGRRYDSDPLTGEEIAVLEGLSAMDLSYLRPGECFRNVTLVVAKVPGLRYAEGIGICRGSVALHAWLDLNGKAIDVTWPLDPDERPSRRFDRMLQRIDYNLRHSHYYGITLSNERVRQFGVSTGVVGPILIQGRGLRRRPARRPGPVPDDEIVRRAREGAPSPQAAPSDRREGDLP